MSDTPGTAAGGSPWESPGELPAVASSLLIGDQIISQTSVTGDGEPDLHPAVRAFLAALPPSQREPFATRCAEVLLVSDQFWYLDSERSDGSGTTVARALPHFAGSAIISRAIRPVGDPEHGREVRPCRSCAALLTELGVKVVSP
ncbi:YwqJ-related putative deaminase [Kitasatospora sp. HPMI-4]|uniref:YwqJ-related putative deaminase n=1 Tax=Kitasatospora sp. HPMI-4 TaxID=3448443 RepID=UPI003F19672B